MTRDQQPDDNKSGQQSQQSQQGHAKQSGDQGQSKPRGFAAMDEQKQRDIASAGGRAAHEKGTAHEFDSEEARAAGKKGGEAVSEDRAHMAEIGRKGGEARQAAAHSGSRGSERSQTDMPQQDVGKADEPENRGKNR